MKYIFFSPLSLNISRVYTFLVFKHFPVYKIETYIISKRERLGLFFAQSYSAFYKEGLWSRLKLRGFLLLLFCNVWEILLCSHSSPHE